MTKIKSTGGSSSYYSLEISNNTGESISCETSNVIQALVGDNFALGNVVKALRRIYMDSLGKGKEGIDMQYDVNKCKYFLDDYLARYSNKEMTESEKDLQERLDSDFQVN